MADDSFLNLDYSSGFPSTSVTSTPVFSPSGSGGFNWGGLVTNVANTGLQIAKDVYGGPRPGTYIKTPQGGVYYRAGEGGVMPTDIPSTFGSSGLLMWGLLGLGAVLIVSKFAGK